MSSEPDFNPTPIGCYWCGEATGAVALLSKDRGRKAQVVLDYVPCAKCQAQMALGITVFAVTTMAATPAQLPLTPGSGYYPTGQWAVVQEDADLWPKSMEAAILKSRKMLMLETEYNLVFDPTPDRE